MKSTVVLIAGLVLAILLNSALYTIDEREQVIITQFGMPVGEPVTKAGLHWKMPFVQTVNRIEKRVLEWDGEATPMTTKNKVFVMVDIFARWEIVDPLVFFRQLTDESRALSRLTGIIGSEARIVIARHDFIEAVRSTKDRKVTRDRPAPGAGAVISTAEARIGVLPAITQGRGELEAEIFANAAPKVKDLGIKILDVRLKRIDYDASVSQSIYQRMITERQQIAERYRSEGAGEAAKISGERERDLAMIESEAYRKVQELEGGADAKATEIYAKAYNQTPEAVELFEFKQTMDAYKKLITGDTTMIFTTDSDLFRFLKSSSPQTAPAAGGSSTGFTPLNKLPTLLEVGR